MLKYLLFVMFLIPLGFMGKMWWVVQKFLYVIFLIVNSYLTLQPWCFGYNFWFDNLSYSKVWMSVWIVLLMIMASSIIFFFL